ncbi:MAG: 3-oxoacyl-(acyl-carrier-protein) reductase, partial [Verrucomicrobiales bacterium]|nr:3-oxoacyl-(acyl-carrier-protein) reductase [Verrucomicrobiales bacterium]
LATAQAFLDSDPQSTVFLGCRENRAAAQTLADGHPDRVHLLTLDVTDPNSWENAVARILERTGRIDILVNNAGNHQDSLLATMPLESWHSVIASNLTGTFLGCRAVLKPMMSQRFGRIINISSLSALLAPAGQTNYAAAKAGVLALTQSLAKETARSGITVNALCPGYIKTDALGSDPATFAELAKRIPARRLGLPEEIAATILHLASPAAAYLTGSTIKIDGGIF